MLTQQDPAPPDRHLPILALYAVGIGVLIAAVLYLFYELSRPVPHPALRNAVSSNALEASPEVLNASNSPSWAALTVTEKAALYPLAGEWEKLGSSGQAKWLAIADRFPSMTQPERERTQERMAEWARLTPEQRRIARDSYLRAHALPPEKRAELLQKYQELPDQEKEHLAAIAREHRSVVAIKTRPKEDTPLPSKAQIREGSEQPVPGVSVAARAAPRPASGAATVAGTAAGSAAPPTGVVPAATPLAPPVSAPAPAPAPAAVPVPAAGLTATPSSSAGVLSPNTSAAALSSAQPPGPTPAAHP